MLVAAALRVDGKGVAGSGDRVAVLVAWGLSSGRLCRGNKLLEEFLFFLVGSLGVRPLLATPRHATNDLATPPQTLDQHHSIRLL